jgi:hypothetical protein
MVRARGVSPADTGVAVGADAKEGAETTNCDSGAGRPETKQQEVSLAAAS